MLMLKLHRSASFGEPLDVKVEFAIANINKPTAKELQQLGEFVLELTDQHVDISPYTPKANNRLNIGDFMKQLRKK